MSGFIIVRVRFGLRDYLESYDIGGGINLDYWGLDREDAFVFDDKEHAEWIAGHWPNQGLRVVSA